MSNAILTDYPIRPYWVFASLTMDYPIIITAIK